ncbi:hypothetical protein BH09VER1_BH09VER1_18570 [soil metagenome]
MTSRSILVRFLSWWHRVSGPWPAVGDQTYIDHSVQFLGAAEIRIGRRSTVGEHCWFNVNHRGTGRLAITVGDHCFIGRRNFFTSGSLIEIGDYVLTGPDCHFLGANHSFDDPLTPYIKGEVLEEKPMHIGVNCWLSSGAVILPGVSIGHGSIIGAAAVVTRDVAPFSIVVGNPGRTIKRFNFQTQKWVTQSEWQSDWEAQLPDQAAYAALLKEKHPRVYVPAIAGSSLLGNL